MAIALSGWLPGGGPGPVAAQDTGTVSGIALGRTESEQRWSRPVETAPRWGFLLGAFIQVPTPATALRVHAEATLARRGGFVLSDFGGNPPSGNAPGGEVHSGEVQSEYVNFALQARVAGAVGPVHIFAGAGPGVDYLVRSRQDAVLAQVIRDEHAAIFTASAGAGAGVRMGGVVVEVEGRWVAGLTNAWRGSSMTARNRSREWVVRVGRVFGAEEPEQRGGGASGGASGCCSARDRPR